MRGIVSAREQYEMLSPFVFAGKLHIAGPAEDVARYRDLNRRHLFNRIPESRPWNSNPHWMPPLTDDENAERDALRSRQEGLQNSWDNMEDMSPEDLEAHRLFNGKYVNGQMQLPKDPGEMNDRERANYYAEQHDSPERSSRQEQHYQQMQPWADQHFGNMQNDADKAYQRFQDYQTDGTHFGGNLHGLKSVGSDPDAHNPDYTGHWAAEHYANGSGALRQRAEEYHGALDNMRKHGPLSMNVETGRYGFQDMEDAHNNMRTELQHKGEFRVPHTDFLSKYGDSHVGPGPADGGFINPRFRVGMGGKNQAAQDAYKINCQRCTLATDAYHRGYNVEAAPNYQPRGGSGADTEFGDHAIANWFRNPATGEGGTWIDAQDQFPGTPNSPKLWDKMNDHIASWGPGARGTVSMSYATPGSYARHIINAQVGDDGKVTYPDAQSSEPDTGPHWRDKTGYRLHGKNKARRAQAQNYAAPERQRQVINQNPSALRYMRTDDKDLSPETAKHMIDRGSAENWPIKPLESAPTPKSIF